MAQPDPKIRALNQEEPVDGERQEVYCTKVGTVKPDEMYIVSGHMDGHGVNQDSNAFMEVAPAISVREAERGSEIGGGWNRTGTHHPTCSRRMTIRISGLG